MKNESFKTRELITVNESNRHLIPDGSILIPIQVLKKSDVIKYFGYYPTGEKVYIIYDPNNQQLKDALDNMQ